jgi:dihydrodipicolinate synthase/N-acetylneuraminate lyase
MLTRATLRGTWATILLPIRADDTIDLAGVADQLDYLTRSGVDGIYAHGTAGEFFTLSEREFDQVNELLVSACRRAHLAFQIGASALGAQASRSRIERAARLVPDAVQVILPNWQPLSFDEVLRTVEGFVVAADGVPLVLYNPPMAGTLLTPEQLGDLGRRFPALVGVKVAGGDDAWLDRARASIGDLAIFVAGHTLASGMARGAHGAYSNVACLSPTGAVRWQSLMRSDHDAALAVERKINDFLDLHVGPWQRRGLSNAALDKALARAGGWSSITTRVRWPMTSMPDDAADRLGQTARAAIPELFEELHT